MKKNVKRFVFYPLLIIGSLFILILLALFYVISTNSGANFALNTAKSSLDGIVNIEGEIKDGTIAHGLNLENLVVNVPDIIDIKADTLNLKYNIFDVIFHRTLNVDNINAENLFVSLLIKKGGDEEKSKDNTEPFKLHFPIDLNVNNLLLNNFAYLSEHTDVKLSHLKASIFVKDSDVKLKDTTVKNLDVLLHNEESKQYDVVSKITNTVEKSVDNVADDILQKHKRKTNLISLNEKEKIFLGIKDRLELINKEVETIKNKDGSINICNLDDNDKFILDKDIKKLFTVVLPINAYVENLKVENVRYTQSGFDTGYITASLTAKWLNTLAEIDNLEVDHKLGHVNLKGSMNFDEYYHIKASLDGVGAISEYTKNNYEGLLYGLQGSINVDGDLRDLKAIAKIQNKDIASIDLRFSALSSGLPLNIKIESNKLEWPLLLETKKASVKNLKICSVGKILDGLETTVKGQISGYGFKDFAINLDGILSTEKSIISNLSLKGIYEKSKTNANFRGVINYGSFYQASGNLKLNTENALFVNKVLQGPLALNSKFFVKLDPNSENLIEADITNVDGSLVLNGQKSNITVKNLLGSYKDGFTFERIEAIQGKNKLHFNGYVGFDQSDLKGTIELNDLLLLTNSIDGAFIGSFKATGTLTDLQTQVTGKSKYLKSESGFEVRDFFFNSVLKTKDLSFNATALSSTLKLSKDLKASKQCVIDVNGKIEHHFLNFTCGGENSGFITFQGGLDRDKLKYKGTLNDFLIANQSNSTLALKAPININVDLEKESFKTDAINLVGDIANLDIEPIIYEKGDLKTGVKLHKLRLKDLNYLMPDDMKLNGNVTINSKINVQKGVPYVNADLDIEDLAFKNPDINLKFTSIKSKVKTNDKLANIVFDFGFKDKKGDGHLDLSILDPFNKKNLSGNLNINNIDLSLFENAGQAFNELQGFANINGNFKGSLEKPLFYGDINIKGNGEPRYDVGQLDDFNINLKTLGTEGNLTGYINLNKTPVNLNGNLNWEHGANADISIKSNNLPLFLLGYGSAFTNLDLNASVKDHISVTGDILIPEAFLTVKGFSGSGIAVSKDEILIDEKGILGRKKKTESNVKTYLDVNLKLGDKLKASAMGLTAQVVGGLHIHKDLDKNDINADGIISLKDGKADLYGRHFDVAKAQTIFAGPIVNPELDVEVIASPDEIEDDVEVGVKVSGFANDPIIKLFSKPTMNDNEILSYMLYGHSLEKSSSAKNQDLSSSALLLGLGLNSTTTLVNAIVGSVGIQNIQLGASGSGSNTQVSVQGYITPKIKLSYGYGVFSQIGEFKLRYEIIRKLYAEFVSSVDQAVDLVYSFEF